MNFLPKSIERAISALSILPGIGRKTAERLTFFLLKAPTSLREEMGQAILKADENLQFCQDCYHFIDNNQCSICSNQSRDHSIVCIVEDWLDLVAIEKTGIYSGLFHVLGGVISPLDGIGPKDLKIKELEKRIAKNNIKEIILATNPTIEGEATAVYIFRIFQNNPLKITRLARGLPMGGDLEYTDQNTLRRAFEGRISF